MYILYISLHNAQHNSSNDDDDEDDLKVDIFKSFGFTQSALTSLLEVDVENISLTLTICVCYESHPIF